MDHKSIAGIARIQRVAPNGAYNCRTTTCPFASRGRRIDGAPAHLDAHTTGRGLDAGVRRDRIVNRAVRAVTGRSHLGVGDVVGAYVTESQLPVPVLTPTELLRQLADKTHLVQDIAGLSTHQIASRVRRHINSQYGLVIPRGGYALASPGRFSRGSLS